MRHVFHQWKLTYARKFLDFELLKVYPNPFTEYLVIESAEAYAYRMYSIKGELIEQEVSQTSRIDVSSLRAGIYLNGSDDVSR